MKTLINDLDKVIRLEQGDFYIICGKHKYLIEKLFYQIMYNYLKQRGKCLSVYGKETNQELDCYRNEKELSKSFDIKTKYVNDDFNLNKCILYARRTKPQFVLLNISQRLLSDEVYENLQNLCSDKNISVFLLPRLQFLDEYKKYINEYKNKACYVIEVNEQTNNHNFTSVSVFHPDWIDIASDDMVEEKIEIQIL
ncbi:MAG: hypothetical protein PHX62_00030 [Bacilli bacterium]|nr:hypothetical protein [Bacilli bacterium]